MFVSHLSSPPSLVAYLSCILIIVLTVRSRSRSIPRFRLLSVSLCRKYHHPSKARSRYRSHSLSLSRSTFWNVTLFTHLPRSVSLHSFNPITRTTLARHTSIYITGTHYTNESHRCTPYLRLLLREIVAHWDAWQASYLIYFVPADRT